MNTGHFFYHEAVYATHPLAVSVCKESAFAVDGTLVDLNESLIEAEIIRLQAEFDSKQYQRKRAEEYPPWESQLDDIFHNGIDGWKASVQVVKDKYPKP
jgi:hypothetical protein